MTHIVHRSARNWSCWFGVALFALSLSLTSNARGHDTGAQMFRAAKNLQAALTDAQRAQSAFPLGDAERKNWHFIPKDNRRGVPLREMSPAQQQLTYVLLNSALSHHGFAEAVTIMSLEQILHELENKNTVRDPVKYYVSIFGEPSENGTWGWRIEGHHLSVNFLLDRGKVIATTPSFFGSNPAHVLAGQRKDLAVLAQEEDLARTLVLSFGEPQRQVAVLEVTAPNDIITGPGRAAEPLDPKGIGYAALLGEQQFQLKQLMRSHIFRLRDSLAQEYWTRIETAGWENVHFAWAGSVDPQKPHYYRIQGPTFLLEYDNTQNNANHVHCVWRDMQNDFGDDVLRKHYAESHPRDVSANPMQPVNQLTDSEIRSGWQLLFDGRTLHGWRNFRSDVISAGWTIEEGAITRSGQNAGDIVTAKQYKNFELSLEYNVEPQGNSGILFRVTEDLDKPWQSGPEIQIQDGIPGKAGDRSGWLYQRYKPTTPLWSREVRAAAGMETPEVADPSRPAGQWNHVYLRVTDDQSEVILNGISFYYFNIGSDDWNQRVARSEFAKFPQFGKSPQGHLCLQDQGNRIAFRNIKIRELQPDGKLRQQPIDGILPVRSELAFPNLEWEGWQPEDESGKIKPLRVIDLTAPRHETQAAKRIFVATQDGRVYSFENNVHARQAKLVLDIRNRVRDYQFANECGLLGLALHPQFIQNGQLFVHYFSGKESATIVSRFQISATDPTVADPNSEEILLKIPQPFENHNGGAIEFGADGCLYIAVGDGGDRNDPLGHGQNLETWLGAILRIDVDAKSGDAPYSVPRDNPFVGHPKAKPEIYAYGLRNVWRFAFDPKTNDLWAGDVGQDLWEEVNLIRRGGNYGWSGLEGAHLFGNTQPKGETVEPAWEYDHLVGKSITGGRVYRGSRLPELQGLYLYADYVSGKIWALDYDTQKQSVRRNLQLIGGGTPVLAFGQDQTGEVYYLTESAKGECIYRFER
ncbi:MAG: DUF3500 domain-containing protein [Planctomycetota bacterium]|nr:DUF3500 domain-containing protein [Planctomycetota bacterium]MDA1177343.1 DUF3500 domain-containing protein [Planctomycetota bacterium]